MKIGIHIPHIFAQEQLKNKIIFAPLDLALNLADELSQKHEIILFTPGKINTKNAKNLHLDLSLLEQELEKENCTLPEFIIKNPLAFISISKQYQAELTRIAFETTERELDLLHIFISEDEIPLYFSNLLSKPTVFTHHDPFNFYRKYRVRFPKLKNLNYVSISNSQRETAPKNLNFVGTVYNGLKIDNYPFNPIPKNYFAFLGRIVRNKGCHTAIQVCKKSNNQLKIAGKYYAGNDKTNSYWDNYIKPELKSNLITYEGFLKPPKQTSEFLQQAKALLFPIEWSEPFGMVIIESLASGTPVIAFNYGAVSEIIKDGVNGFIVNSKDEMISAIQNIDQIDRTTCRRSVEKKFTIKDMAKGYERIYKKVLMNP